MIPMTLAAIAEVVGGEVVDEPSGAPVTVTGPAFLDSRAPDAGGLFVAVVGERVDGHDYSRLAVDGGAAGVLGSRPTGVPTVVVDDPVAALGRLARHMLDALPDIVVLALTGSQGKTGTKDYLAQVLATAGPTVATEGNLNNELGVPLTVLRATPDTRYLVVEMGARGVGHIGYLCRIAPPRVATVLNVGTAHVGEFGSREAIARAKGEILQALPLDGVAVLPFVDPNSGDPLLGGLRALTTARTITFGDDVRSDLAVTDTDLDDLGHPTAVFNYGGRQVRQTLRQLGRHQIWNAAAAAAMAVAAGVDFETVVAALGEAGSRSRWRMELTECADGTVVVNDAYNANPESMSAALATLREIGARRGARTVAVLGEMKELGETSETAHRELGSLVSRLGIDVLLAVGEPGRVMVEGAQEAAARPAAEDAGKVTSTVVPVRDREAAMAWLRTYVSPGDVVLVKASRGVALEVVAETLVKER